jgi:hypothetical protein
LASNFGEMNSPEGNSAFDCRTASAISAEVTPRA